MRQKQFQFRLARILLRLLTLRVRTYPAGQAPVEMSARHKVTTWEDIWNSATLKDLSGAYQTIFAESPWNESHSDEEICSRLQTEVGDSEGSVLVLMHGDNNLPVSGFCWGGLVTLNKGLAPRIIRARFQDREDEGQQKVLTLLAALLLAGIEADEPLLFLDELAVHRRFRGGLGPIQFLCRPPLESAWDRGVRKALCWTSAASPIYNLAVFMGFLPVHKMDDLVFLLNPDIESLLKIVQNLRPEAIRPIMKVMGRVVR